MYACVQGPARVKCYYIVNTLHIAVYPLPSSPSLLTSPFSSSSSSSLEDVSSVDSASSLDSSSSPTSSSTSVGLSWNQVTKVQPVTLQTTCELCDCIHKSLRPELSHMFTLISLFPCSLGNEASVHDMRIASTYQLLNIFR